MNPLMLAAFKTAGKCRLRRATQNPAIWGSSSLRPAPRQASTSRSTPALRPLQQSVAHLWDCVVHRRAESHMHHKCSRCRWQCCTGAVPEDCSSPAWHGLLHDVEAGGPGGRQPGRQGGERKGQRCGVTMPVLITAACFTFTAQSLDM